MRDALCALADSGGSLMRVRQSMLKQWARCSLSAKFTYLDGLPGKSGSKQVFGTCIHAALHHYNLTGDIDNAIKLFLEAWDDPAVLGEHIDVWTKYTSFGGLRQKGLDILRAYHDRTRLEPRTVIAAEHRFLVPFGRHELEGTLDLLELRKNHKGKELLAVVDYKTATHKPTTAALALDLQFSVYIAASLQPEFWKGNGDGFPPIVNGDWWWETLKDIPRRGIWVQLWNDGREADAGGRDDDDFGRFHRLIDEIERAIEFNVFVPSPGEACSICDHVNGPCPVKVPTRDEWEHRADTDEEASLP